MLKEVFVVFLLFILIGCNSNTKYSKAYNTKTKEITFEKALKDTLDSIRVASKDAKNKESIGLIPSKVTITFHVKVGTSNDNNTKLTLAIPESELGFDNERASSITGETYNTIELVLDNVWLADDETYLYEYLKLINSGTGKVPVNPAELINKKDGPSGGR